MLLLDCVASLGFNSRVCGCIQYVEHFVDHLVARGFWTYLVLPCTLLASLYCEEDETSTKILSSHDFQCIGHSFLDGLVRVNADQIELKTYALFQDMRDHWLIGHRRSIFDWSCYSAIRESAGKIICLIWKTG